MFAPADTLLLSRFELLELFELFKLLELFKLFEPFKLFELLDGYFVSLPDIL